MIVSHGNPIRSIAGLSLAEGEAGIFKPKGRGDQGLVARVQPHKWQGLLTAAQ